jgi:hypothetical protein
MLCCAIDNPVICKIRGVIHFLQAENMSAAEIHLELSMNGHVFEDQTGL